MLRSIKSPQRAPRMLSAIVQADGTVSVGSRDVSVSVAASVYTITFARPFARVPIVSCSIYETVGTLVLSDLTASSVKVNAFEADISTPQDAVFHIQILGFDASDEY